MAENLQAAQKKPFQLLTEDFDSSNIKKSYLDLTPVGVNNKEFPAFTLENVFSPEECKSLIEFSEGQGFKKAAVNYGDEEVINENYRTGFRVIVDDEEFVEKLWTRISSHIPVKLKGAEVVGLNERLRVLKYNASHFFAPHSDAHYTRPDNSFEISLLTIQMYINEEFEGGETTFLAPYTYENRVPLKPKTGMVLIFDQDLRHEGSTVISGTKYTIRTDIMYRYAKK